MAAPKPEVKLTYEDYAKTLEGERWELIDGELTIAPSPKGASTKSNEIRLLECRSSQRKTI